MSDVYFEEARRYRPDDIDPQLFDLVLANIPKDDPPHTAYQAAAIARELNRAATFERFTTGDGRDTVKWMASDGTVVLQLGGPIGHENTWAISLATRWQRWIEARSS